MTRIARAFVLASIPLLVLASYLARADEMWKGRVCYARKEGDRILLHLMDPDGKNDQLLPNQPGKVNLMPAWAPDGKRIAFMSGETTNGRRFGLYVIAIDGSGLKRLAPEEQLAGLPAWSPDGKIIAFVAERQNEPQLMTINADGSGARLLNVGMRFAVAPFFSPDGKRLAFTGGDRPDDKLALSLYTANLDGTGAQKLSGGEGILLGGAGAWSPDGSAIAYATLDPEKKEGSVHVWLVADKVDNRLASIKLGDGELESFPVCSWSPDGKWLITCQAGDDGKASVWRLSADGEKKERITPAGATCYCPAWSRS